MDLPVPVIALPLLGYDEERQETFVDNYVDNRVDVHVPSSITVTIAAPDKEHYVDSSSVAPQYIADWDSFVGQEAVKQELEIYIAEAFETCMPLPHILLAASMPGVGKTSLARLIAQTMGQRMIMLVPPFKPEAMYEAALQLKEHEFLFIDEIHKLADHGRRAAENLLHMLEEHVLYLDGKVVPLEHFTVIGATTDAEALPEPVVDRFTIQPFFEPYSDAEMVRIVHNFARYFGVTLTPETMVTLALSSRRTPRVARALVEAARALQTARGHQVRGVEVLEFKRVDPDGITRLHKQYILALYRHCRQIDKGKTVFRAGVDTIQTLLRQGPQGVARAERFLIESGFLVKTGRGRMLTDRGIEAALRYTDEGVR